jgi:triphosphoribosyl-dephospho-CoA synthetase
MSMKVTQTSKGKGHRGIAMHGEAFAAAKADRTRVALEKAMRKIEADIEKNDGIYPYSKSEITTAEVLRRAGLSLTLLQKPRHRELRDNVNAWVEGVQLKLRKGIKVVRSALTERTAAAQSEVDLIRQRWCEAELEYIENINSLTILTEACARLEAENARLRVELAGSNVLPLHRTEGA